MSRGEKPHLHLFAFGRRVTYHLFSAVDRQAHLLPTMDGEGALDIATGPALLAMGAAMVADTAGAAGGEEGGLRRVWDPSFKWKTTAQQHELHQLVLRGAFSASSQAACSRRASSTTRA